MSAKIKDYKIGKFQLPRQAHVVHLEVRLGEGETLGLVRIGDEPLQLWPSKGLDKSYVNTLLAPVAQRSDTPIDDTGIKKLVRASAEHGNVLHTQIQVRKGEDQVLFHAFATVSEFNPSMLKFSVLKDIEIEPPEDES